MAKQKIGIHSEQEWGTGQTSPAGIPEENGRVKVRYEFITGEVSEIEVDQDFGDLLVDFERQDYNNDHKETRRHVSLDGMDYEGEMFASGADTAGEVESGEDISRLYGAMESLSPAQRELVLKVFFEKVRVADIARAEGVTEAAVRNRLQKIYARLKKFLILGVRFCLSRGLTMRDLKIFLRKEVKGNETQFKNQSWARFGRYCPV